jgi:hypothetical protein
VIDLLLGVVLKHAVRALYPRTEWFPGIEDTGLDTFVPRYLRETSPLMKLGVAAGLLVFVWTPLLTVYLPLPSFLLPRRLLDRHADRISTHPIYVLRSAMLLLKVVAGLCWGAHPEVRARLGMPPLPPDPDEWRTT